MTFADFSPLTMFWRLFFRRFGLAAAVLLPFLYAGPAMGQERPVLVFAHNDYLHSRPFLSSYESRVDYMEVDVFFRKDRLLVAHTAVEIREDRTLQDLYLLPLNRQIDTNNGFIYPGRDKTLTLMIDVKTDGAKTLQAVVEELNHFPAITGCPTLMIVVSGNVPAASEWENYPAYIHFDGRPTVTYTPDQLQRIALISANFRDYSNWNGRGEMSNEERKRLEAAITDVHGVNKRVRFWSAPDFEIAWRTLINLGVDVINTDDVEGAVMFVRQ